jgi:hypothetical protein
MKTLLNKVEEFRKNKRGYLNEMLDDWEKNLKGEELKGLFKAFGFGSVEMELCLHHIKMLRCKA